MASCEELQELIITSQKDKVLNVAKSLLDGGKAPMESSGGGKKAISFRMGQDRHLPTHRRGISSLLVAGSAKGKSCEDWCQRPSHVPDAELGKCHPAFFHYAFNPLLHSYPECLADWQNAFVLIATN